MHYTKNYGSFSLSPAAGERAGERSPQCRLSRSLISILQLPKNSVLRPIRASPPIGVGKRD